MTFNQGIFILLLGLLLSACGGGGGSTTTSESEQVIDQTTNTTYDKIFELYHFDVISGSDSMPEDGVLEINSGINQGAFSVEWAGDVQEAQTGAPYYHADAYISTDGELSLDDDIWIIKSICNIDTKVQYCGGDEWFMNCNLTSDYHQVVCGEPGGELASIPLPVQQIPQNLYLIFRFCDRHLDECILKTKPIVVY